MTGKVASTIAMAALAVFTLAGCSSMRSSAASSSSPLSNASGGGQELEALPDEFRIPSGIPVPPNTVVLPSESSVSGVTEPTSGFVVMRSKNSPNALLNFYRDSMPRDGWQPSGISQGKRNYISFIRREPNGATRVSSIRIEPIERGISNLGSAYASEIELFVSEAVTQK
ncbi:hypothetical protein [Radicibacter daui]|uniref:hypothetical protein n=1 Tax=Radicibacter daui TaxID=3064829 RepID=UPI004046A1FE